MHNIYVVFAPEAHFPALLGVSLAAIFRGLGVEHLFSFICRGSDLPPYLVNTGSKPWQLFGFAREVGTAIHAAGRANLRLPKG